MAFQQRVDMYSLSCEVGERSYVGRYIMLGSYLATLVLALCTPSSAFVLGGIDNG